MRHRWDAFGMGLVGAIVGLVTALVVVAELPVGAATGEPMILGEVNGSLKGTVMRSGGVRSLKIVNNRAAGVPLELVSQPGQPPMRVTSRTKVVDLNADLLDGRTSAFYLTGWAWCSTDSIAASTDWSCARTVTVPSGGGTILMRGSIDFYNTKSVSNPGNCVFQVDSADVVGSERTVHVQGLEWGMCASDGAGTYPAGTYEVAFMTRGFTVPAFDADDAMMTVIVLPN